jgi:hypothetical protein
MARSGQETFSTTQVSANDNPQVRGAGFPIGTILSVVIWLAIYELLKWLF